MSVFVAVVPPEPVLGHLESALRAVPAKPHLRRTDARTWHITLAFLGDLDASTTTRLGHALEPLAASTGAVELSLAGSGVFGEALWVGVRGDLAPLALAVQAAARKVGIDVEKRAFQPHLTVIRAQRGRSLRPELDLLAPYVGPRWQARELHLIRSHPGRPLRHESLGIWPLGG